MVGMELRSLHSQVEQQQIVLVLVLAQDGGFNLFFLLQTLNTHCFDPCRLLKIFNFELPQIYPLGFFGSVFAMNGLEMRGFRGPMKLINEGSVSVSVSVPEPARPPWTAMFADNRSHRLKSEQFLSFPDDLYVHPRLPDFQALNFPYSYGGGRTNHNNNQNNQFGDVSEICEQMRLYSSHLNGGGSLVLDSARGELVNASKMMTPKEILEAKAVAASKSHSEAERRRRERINSHLATLRTLLPSTTKTDKASLLAEVIDHVKDLKRRASEIAKGNPVPTDVDELRVEADGDGKNNEGRILIKASLCCDDRPDLLADLNRTLHSLSLKTVKAEISTLGGRMKNVFIMTTTNEKISGKDQENPSVNCVQEALRAVIERAASNELLASNKRQRIISLDPTNSLI
ncbi:transcription factor bHLH30 [Cryptomeria japonica]|uniref:transcription factor bHLH30 n=1 Tax=Cryptomeria japonica TaxID=3369 RepID=UPI0025AC2AF5|nr:transcription factor bHLH30 [Cryptomeria japonica]